MPNWSNIRSVNDSQRTGFEKLCCQLAAYETAPEGSDFIVKGDPDAGVECYWKLPNGDEWGWQAKYFLSTPDTTQWGQITHSLRRAISTHPKIKKYYVCIPIDRGNPRTPGRTDFMDKWNSYVEKWKKEAQARGRDIEFVYWGESEIIERLSREEHRGRRLFWFNEEQFSNSWFKNRINDTIENVGPRYSPKINVELPINSWFNCLGRTNEFNEEQLHLYRKLKKSNHLIQSGKDKIKNKNELDDLYNKLNSISSILRAIKSPKNPIDFDMITQLADESLEIVERFIVELKNAENQQTELDDNSSEKSFNIRTEQVESNYHAFMGIIREIKRFARNECSILTNLPALLIYGEAGIGKTHLLCDIAKNRIEKELPTLLLLGGHFNDEEPWSQIIKQLGLSCTKEEFLGALEASAQLTGSRALILIDALNEGSGANLWPNHIAGMLSTLSRYPWIGIAISVRDSYLDLIIPEQASSKLTYLMHKGFSSNEYNATEIFFEYYEINSPKMPLLNPEFSNPLFLKIFCKSLKNRNLSEIEPNVYGISSIFRYFLESVNAKLKPVLGFDPLSAPVMEAVTELAKNMAKKQIKWLSRSDAKWIVNNILGCSQFENSLFSHMISEGILSEDITWIDKNPEHIIRFTYERFTDHMITEFLLKSNLDYIDPHNSFAPDKPLGSLFHDERTIYKNIGFIDALFIQIPEETEYELGEIIPNLWNITGIRNGFLKSLFWRNLDTFNDKTTRCINKVIEYDDSFNKFLKCILTLSLIVKHPYNAKKLHNWLKEFELADRDLFWSIFLYQQYGHEGSVDRLIDWALNYKNHENIENDVLYLYGLVLGWFLTTSHRYVRDKSTKALVNLFTNHIPILRQVIKEFLNVNDPYILERLFAVAYGCAMRSNDLEEVVKLAKDAYGWIFVGDEVFPHILLRNYARGIIEIALIHESIPNIDLNKIQPPYTSSFPSEIPEKKKLKGYCDCKSCTKEETLSCKWIYQSVLGFGDFSRYVLGADSGHSDWSSDLINEPEKLSKKEIYENFVNSLTNRQKTYMVKYLKSIYNLKEFKELKSNFDLYNLTGINFSKHSGLSGLVKKNKNKRDENKANTTEIYDFLKEYLMNELKDSEGAFWKTIRSKKRDIFQKEVVPYLKNPHETKNYFNMELAQRWIFQKVFNLGWTPKKFGIFDRRLSYDSTIYGRASKKPERISKKYQWIAYHEFLARLSDNFKYIGDDWQNELEPEYRGPWQIHTRDIDPSCLLIKTETNNWEPSTNTWWFPATYENWEREDDCKWIKFEQDLPNIIDLLEVVNPEDDSKWLTLDSNYTWEQPHPPEEDRYESPYGHIDYSIRSYIVKKSDFTDLWDWCIKQNYRSMEMPHTSTLHYTFLGEFFWSPSFKYENGNKWTSDEDKLPCKVLGTTIDYSQEDSSYDCSIDDSYLITLPTNEIFNKMRLYWAKEGYFNNNEGVLTAFNPSIDNKGPGSFLIREDDFIKFLDDNDYEILWLIMGEKYIHGDKISRERLEIMGIYRINENRIEGKIKTEFKD